MKPNLKAFVVLIVLSGLWTGYAQDPKVSDNWQAFKEAKDRSPGEILTDYSYAGYEHGEKAIPDIKEPVFKVTDFGAIPDDLSSDEDAIRKTVAAAEKAGGGVVLFPPGKFLVWMDRTKVSSIPVHSSRVVIRGAGSGEGGTLIRALHSGYGVGPYPVPKKGPDFDAIPYVFVFQKIGTGPTAGEGEAEPEPSSTDKKSVKVTADIKRADLSVQVDSVPGWKVGDWITLKSKTPKLNSQLLAGLEPDPTWVRILEGVGIAETHQIREINGKTIKLREPVLVNLPADFGVTASLAPMIEQVGVEDIAFQGGWRADFVHHRSALDDEGWDAILFDGVANGWVRRCSFLNVNSGVYLKKSSACSLLENRFDGTKGHYDMTSRSDTSFNLLGLTEDRAGQLHGASTGNRSSGTTVWRWKLKETQSVDSHGNGPYATLIDRVDGGTMTKSGGPGPAFPNHMRWLVFWNFLYQGSDEMPINLWEMKKNGVAKFVKPLFVGLHGKEISFQPDTLQGNESAGHSVFPESLYEAQLELRLGQRPAWVDAVRSEWEKQQAVPLPDFGVADSPAKDVYPESFLLDDLLKDFQGLMVKQELGWTIPVEFENGETGVTLVRDYVLLRTLLHQLCTYATPIPLKDAAKSGASPLGPVKIQVSVSDDEIIIKLPITASPKDLVKNKVELEIAKQIAPACQAVVEAGPSGVKLTVRR